MPHEGDIPGTTAAWLASAKSDPAMARAPLPQGAIFESLCFHAQPAAEKAIKAVYKANRKGFAYTHNIRFLLQGLAQRGGRVPDPVWQAVDLTRFAWETRYPSFDEPVSEEEYREAVRQAEAVVTWAEGEIAE